MSRFRTALLAAAAALVIAPTMANAQDDRPRHQRHGDDGEARPMSADEPRGALFRAPPPPPAARPAAPAGPAGSAPRGNWGGGQPAVQPAPPRPQNGVWPGGGQWRGGARGAWQGDRANDGDRAAPRPVPPQGLNSGQDWRNRADWRGGDDRRDNDHRWDRGSNRGDDRREDRADRRGDDRRWDGVNRGQWGNGDRANRGPWPDRRRWDNHNRPQWNSGDQRGVWSGNGHRWDTNRWRNDNRYDWRRWRDTHHDLFRWPYRAPRGYNYRSVYRGFFLEPFFYGSSYWLDDPYEYRLPPVEWPLRWVRYYDDALLVDVTSGEVVDVIQGFFF